MQCALPYLTLSTVFPALLGTLKLKVTPGNARADICRSVEGTYRISCIAEAMALRACILYFVFPWSNLITIFERIVSIPSHTVKRPNAHNYRSDIVPALTFQQSTLEVPDKINHS